MSVTMPDGTRVQLRDWTHHAYFSSFAYLLLEADPVMVRPGYTIQAHEPKPAPITLDEFARRAGLSAWRLRCAVTEYQHLERKGRSGDRVWRRLVSFLMSEVAEPPANL